MIRGAAFLLGGMMVVGAYQSFQAASTPYASVQAERDFLAGAWILAAAAWWL